MKKESIVATFSGGATSGYMCYWLQQHMSHLYDLHFVYANTGQEHEETLIFVDKVDKLLGLNLTWVEGVTHQNKRKSNTHKIVSYDTASRDGQPFEDVIRKYGLPNQNFLHCTRELKNNPIKSYKASIGLKEARIALGIRADEFRRVKARPDAIYPLATIGSVSKQDVIDWWNTQEFQLNLPEHLGNCVWCYKKSDKKLQMVKNDNPEYFNFISKMESKYKMVKANKPTGRCVFRHNRSVEDVLTDSNLPDNVTIIDECAEECGSVIVD